MEVDDMWDDDEDRAARSAPAAPRVARKDLPRGMCPGDLDAPVPVVLTDERINHLWDIHVGMPTAQLPLNYKDIRLFARAVLAAQPVNPWKVAVLDQLAVHHLDATTDEPPDSILRRIIDMAVQMAAQPAPVPTPEDGDRVEFAIDEYVDGYIMEGDDCHYQPDDGERAMIKDAMMGLLVDPGFLTAYEATQPAPVPPGYVLVPVEPTPNMLAALSGEWHPSRHEKYRAKYRAMIAAAPGAKHG